MQEYTLEFLEEQFKEHDEQWEKSIIEHREKYKKDYPDEEYPIADDFSLCRALFVLTKELRKIREKHVG